MNKYTQICTKCFKYQRFCKCEDKRGIYPIDSQIAYVIRHLNMKGYITGSCCGGHKEDTLLYIYIRFHSKYYYDLKTVPEGFIFDAKEQCLYYKDGRTLTAKQKYDLIREKMKVLKEWVKAL